MSKSKFKIIGITVSITFFYMIALILFLKAIGVIFEEWFSTNAITIAVVTGIIVLIGLISSGIALGTMISKSKGFF